MGICYLLALGRAWPFETHSPLHSQPKPTAVGNFKQLAWDRPGALSYVATVTLTIHNQCMNFLSSNLLVVSFWPLKLIETTMWLLFTSNPNFNLLITLKSFYPQTACWHTLKSIHKVHPFLTSWQQIRWICSSRLTEAHTLCNSKTHSSMHTVSHYLPLSKKYALDELGGVHKAMHQQETFWR